MRPPQDLSDRVAYALTVCFRWMADTFFAKRYGHRAVVLAVRADEQSHAQVNHNMADQLLKSKHT